MAGSPDGVADPRESLPRGWDHLESKDTTDAPSIIQLEKNAITFHKHFSSLVTSLGYELKM